MRGSINYLKPMSVRPAFFAHDFSRDNLELDAQNVEIRNARTAGDAPTLAREGFTLARHRTAVSDFQNADEIQHIYLPEAERLLQELTGARRVIMMRGAVARFGERSSRYRSSFNSRPARFTHVDYTERSAPGLLQRLLSTAAPDFKPQGRYAGYNVWRVLSEPPQDVPLAVCDARSVQTGDLVPADAVFDAPGAPEFSFEAYLVRYNPRHRWSYFPDMTVDETLVFKAYDTDSSQPLRVPHCAFDDPDCPQGVSPRASIEVRGFAFFDD
jgi:hypothetical protein